MTSCGEVDDERYHVSMKFGELRDDGVGFDEEKGATEATKVIYNEETDVETLIQIEPKRPVEWNR